MEIHWSRLAELSEEERSASEARIRDLGRQHDDLVDVRIAGRETAHHRHGDREVRIVCRARGREIIVSRTRDDLGLALNEALDVFEREIHRLRDLRASRRSERPARPPYLGIVERIFREDGYGFILTDRGERVYFHRNAVTDGLDFEGIEEGERVGLNVEAGERGPQARSVTPPPPDAPSP